MLLLCYCYAIAMPSLRLLPVIFHEQDLPDRIVPFQEIDYLIHQGKEDAPQLDLLDPGPENGQGDGLHADSGIRGQVQHVEIRLDPAQDAPGPGQFPVQGKAANPPETPLHGLFRDLLRKPASDMAAKIRQLPRP